VSSLLRERGPFLERLPAHCNCCCRQSSAGSACGFSPVLMLVISFSLAV
jgi:hypothetical protein